MKKETLEEVAERYVNKYYSEEGYKRDIEESIKFGAKWQHEMLIRTMNGTLTHNYYIYEKVKLK